jgi:hypothetical protein
MNPVQLGYLSASLLVGIIFAAMLPTRPTASIKQAPRHLTFSLIALILALLCVGIVSHTFVRHIIQSLPVAVPLGLVIRGSSFGTAAAAPIFTFWLGIVVNIWLFLLGIARIFTGTFTTIEIALTIAMAIACAVGLGAIIRHGSRLSIGNRVATAVAVAVAQFATMIASFQPMFR